MTPRMSWSTRRPIQIHRVRPRPCNIPQPTLADQLEDLLDQVWRSEREWSFDNRIALANARLTVRARGE